MTPWRSDVSAWSAVSERLLSGPFFNWLRDCLSTFLQVPAFKPVFSSSCGHPPLCVMRGQQRKWLSMRKTAPHGAPRRDIRSPWRQLLSLPIPCHAHWPRSYCQSPAHPPAICGKPCFRGPSGCMRGAGTFGPLLRAGCAGAAWVRHGNLGSGMRAGRRCLAPRVGSVRWAGSLRATRARALVALAGA